MTEATVNITITVSGLGAWDDTCTMGQIRKQAAESAIGKVQNMIQSRLDMKMIGDPNVLVITRDDKE